MANEQNEHFSPVLSFQSSDTCILPTYFATAYYLSMRHVLIGENWVLGKLVQCFFFFIEHIFFKFRTN